MYTHTTTLRLRDTDATGAIYFPNIFDLSLQALEAYMESVQMPASAMIRNGRCNLPVVRAEADFLKPICTGEHLRIDVISDKVGDTSFTVLYRIRNQDGVEMALVRITHVLVNRTQGGKTPLTDELRGILNGLRSETGR